MSKSNHFVKNFKNINRIINNLLEENLNKLKLENLINLLKNNIIVLTFVAVFVLFISYLLLPTFFNQNEVSKVLKNELAKKLNLNFNFSNKINYNFFPKPHFIIKDSIILFNNKEISNVKNLNIFIPIDNLYSLKNINISDVLIENANFDFNNKNYNFFTDLLKNNYKEDGLKIKNSNIFFKSSEEDILFINKIVDMEYYFDSKELKNVIQSKNKLFNFPYEIKMYKDIKEKKLISKLNINLLKLQIQNEFNYYNKIKKGKADIILNKSKSNLTYNTNLKFFEFIYSDKKENPSYLYNGKINLNPFYSNFEGKTQNLNLIHLFDVNSFIPQILKSEIFNKKNVDFEMNIDADNIYNNTNFKNINLNFKIKEGLFDIDHTIFQWKNNINFKLNNSLIFVKNGQLILDAKLELKINNPNEIYKTLLTPKNFRKNIDKIDLNFSYNFDENTITLNDIRVDGIYSQKLNKILNNLTFKDDKLQNKIYIKNLLNEAFKSYSG